MDEKFLNDTFNYLVIKYTKNQKVYISNSQLEYFLDMETTEYLLQKIESKKLLLVKKFPFDKTDDEKRDFICNWKYESGWQSDFVCCFIEKYLTKLEPIDNFSDTSDEPVYIVKGIDK